MLDAALLKRLAPFALGGVAAGCLAWIISTQVAGRSEAAELHTIAATLEMPAPLGRPAPATADLLAMALFSSVTGAAELEVAAAQPTGPAIGLRLHGISISPRRRAALISAGGGDAIWFSQGEEGPGFSVQSIDRRRVAVTVAGVAQELNLYPDQPAATQPVGPVQEAGPSTPPEAGASPAG